MNWPIATLAAALLGLAGAAGAAPQTAERDWNFTVYLDDDRVGHHRFSLDETPAMRELRSEARFSVKLLMIEAYRYQHQARETWRGDCLGAIEAQTDDNGERTTLRGQSQGDRFELRKDDQEEKLPACIMSFAYWNPLMLRQSHLLNPQNGEFTPVRIQPRGRESVPVRGQAVAADKWHLDAGKFQIDLWYADGGRWVALDSRLDNGRTLRYRIE